MVTMAFCCDKRFIEKKKKKAERYLSRSDYEDFIANVLTLSLISFKL